MFISGISTPVMVGLWHWAANIRLLIYLCVFETTSGILREFPKLFRNIFQTALSNIWGESFRTSWSANVSMWHFGPVLLTVWYAFLGFADSGLRRPSTNKTIPNRFPVFGDLVTTYYISSKQEFPMFPHVSLVDP